MTNEERRAKYAKTQAKRRDFRKRCELVRNDLLQSCGIYDIELEIGDRYEGTTLRDKATGWREDL